ncbi:hypothetical protein J7F02_29205 [Streptomyces sp. ISL-112]|uniref:hypothetical protein n=1 Tax=unclassified Streptomyces TaxID=2593676 RepID=UPI001BEA98F6|nr:MULTISPECIES: hypothetical protein [unclassified Streptomyces]MBT2429573.1 hypothetical protein [Streptomyces sp. ISL-112]MBT2462796.1 hypothetical protein [Streptomyces sp. ISL-63]
MLLPQSPAVAETTPGAPLADGTVTTIGPGLYESATTRTNIPGTYAIRTCVRKTIELEATPPFMGIVETRSNTQDLWIGVG